MNANQPDSPVRIGTVTAVDEGRMVARVYFQDVGIVSDWLTILRHKSRVDDDEHTEIADGHKHEVKLKHWIPKTGDPVLCLYAGGFNANGFILGGTTG